MDEKAMIKMLKNDQRRHGPTVELVRANLEAVAESEDYHLQTVLLEDIIRKYVELEKKVSGLLRNTLPNVVAEELKLSGHYTPRRFDCTIVFGDLVQYTKLAERVGDVEIVQLLNSLFTGFDKIVRQYQGTKIKTIGDCYMVTFGAPREMNNHAVIALRSSIAMIKHLKTLNKQRGCNLEIRIGIHSGPVMGGVIGNERMQFDIFGDNVNIASRFESSGEANMINVSEETYKRTKNHFTFQARGSIQLKNKDMMNAYFVTGWEENHSK